MYLEGAKKQACNNAENALCYRTTTLKQSLPMDVPHFINKQLWISAFDNATSKKILDVNLPQSWPRKQNDTTVGAAVMILEVVNNWTSMLQINILKTKVTTCLEIYAIITILEWLLSTCVCL